jgi:hypothetical protein
VNTRERNNDKNPVGPKTDSVMSTRSSSRGDGRSSTTSQGSASTANSSLPSTDLATTTCRNSDWRSVKRSVKGLWKSVVGV